MLARPLKVVAFDAAVAQATEAEVDAAVEDGDYLCCRICLDSLLDHIAAKVFAPEMD
jgi:hypothetical protein